MNKVALKCCPDFSPQWTHAQWQKQTHTDFLTQPGSERTVAIYTPSVEIKFSRACPPTKIDVTSSRRMEGARVILTRIDVAFRRVIPVQTWTPRHQGVHVEAKPSQKKYFNGAKPNGKHCKAREEQTSEVQQTSEA